MVSVTIVTWNSEQYLAECFAALSSQDYRDLDVVIVDNASEDGTRALLRQVETKWRVIYNEKNVGFAAGQNQAIRASRGSCVLCLNPDVVLSPNFIGDTADVFCDVRRIFVSSDAGVFCGNIASRGPDPLYDGTPESQDQRYRFNRNLLHAQHAPPRSRRRRDRSRPIRSPAICLWRDGSGGVFPAQLYRRCVG
jgi:glycosyltransferase involved in cell wall biosynthesis